MTTNTTDQIPDSADRFALLEMDGPTAPRANPAPRPLPLPAPVAPPPVAAPTYCACQPGPLAIRGVCPRCNLGRRPVVAAAPRTGAVSAEAPVAPADFAVAAAEGAVMGAQAGLVRGGVLRADVNPYAGYNRPVVAVSGEATRYTREGETGSRQTQVLSREERAAHRESFQQQGEQAQQALSDGQLVGGTIAEGHGVLIAWTGRGEMTRAGILEVLAEAGLPEDWAPKSRMAHGQAGKAVEALNGKGYVARAARGGKGETAEMRGWKARWTVGTVNHDAGVEVLGRKVLTVTLTSSDELVCDGDEALATTVRDEFRRLVSSEVFGSADVTDWLRSKLRYGKGAIRLGGALYVPRAAVEEATRLCEALAKRWGTDWMLPALPIATSAQLRQSLANGLATEAQDVLDDLAAQREAAKKAGKNEIGTRAAATLLGRLREVVARAQGYAALLGEEHTREVRRVVNEAIATVEPLVTDTAQRGALIWEDIAGAR